MSTVRLSMTIGGSGSPAGCSSIITFPGLPRVGEVQAEQAQGLQGFVAAGEAPLVKGIQRHHKPIRPLWKVEFRRWRAKGIGKYGGTFGATRPARTTPRLLPDRTPRAEAAGQVAPLAASAGLVEDGVDHPTTRDAGRSTPSAGRVEQVTDEAPLGIGQVGCLGHDRDGARRLHGALAAAPFVHRA
jgi:hypothetical protein